MMAAPRRFREDPAPGLCGKQGAPGQGLRAGGGLGSEPEETPHFEESRGVGGRLLRSGLTPV